jgi:hypothetical protein
MAASDDRSDEQRQKSLLDSEVTTTRLDRRSFLARGAVAVGVTTSCADNCDTDTVTDNDFGPFGDPIDRPRDRTCDRDG